MSLKDTIFFKVFYWQKMSFSILLGNSLCIATPLFLSTYNRTCPGRRRQWGIPLWSTEGNGRTEMRDRDLEMRLCCLRRGRKGAEWRNPALRTGEARKLWFPEPLLGALPSDTCPWTQPNRSLTSDSRTTKEHICVVLGHQVWRDFL